MKMLLAGLPKTKTLGGWEWCYWFEGLGLQRVAQFQAITPGYVRSFRVLTKGYAIAICKVGRISRCVRHCEAVVEVVIKCLLPAEAI